MLAYVKLIIKTNGTLSVTPRQTWVAVDQTKTEKQLVKELTPYILERNEKNMFMALCEVEGRDVKRNIYCIEKLGKGALQECKRKISN